MNFLIFYAVMAGTTFVGSAIIIWRELKNISLKDLGFILAFSFIWGLFWFISIPTWLSGTKVGNRISQTIEDFLEKPRWKV